jgi:hypothetical protein
MAVKEIDVEVKDQEGNTHIAHILGHRQIV